MSDCTVKLQRADKLIGGLGGERIRWQATVEQMGKDMVNVVGDVVIAAGSIAYSGERLYGRDMIAPLTCALASGSSAVAWDHSSDTQTDCLSYSPSLNTFRSVHTGVPSAAQP